MSQEDDFRLANLVTCYGRGTRSYNRSAEKREIRRQVRAATEKYLRESKAEIVAGPICCCRSFQYPHDLSAHEQLESEYDWTPWQEREW